MRYLSVCSGIEAASVAWEPLGWEPVAFSEIDPFACAVLAQRFPGVPNLGSLENYEEWQIEPGTIDVLVGGTPCQSFSVAGLRKGLDDPRGNLALVYLGLVDRLRPRYVVWENVPGVLSVDGGRAFGSFLGGLAQLGYGWAYRVMDAQYVRVESHPRAVPQRRRRVFVVGCARGDWQRAASILLEPEGVRGDLVPRREAGKGAPRSTRPGAPGGGVAGTVAAKWAKGTGGPAGDECQNLVPMTVPIALRQTSRGEKDTNNRHNSRGGPAGTGIANDGDPAFTVSERGQAVAVARPAPVAPTLGTAWGDRHPGTSNQDFVSQSGPDAVEPGYIHPRQLRGSPSNQLGIKPHAKVTDALTTEGPGAVLVEPLPFDTTQVTSVLNRSNPQPGDPCHPLTRGGNPPAVAFAQNQRMEVRVLNAAGALTSIRRGDAKNETLLATAATTMAVRRLTPRECERLQGFPDDWTAIVYRGKPAADGPRYKALGNSMAVNVMRWIGERIADVDR